MHRAHGPAPLLQRLGAGGVATVPATDDQQHVSESLTRGSSGHGEWTGPPDTAPRLVDGVEEMQTRLGRQCQRRVARVDVHDLVRESRDAAGRRELPRDLVRVALGQQLVLGALDVGLRRRAAADQVVLADHLGRGYATGREREMLGGNLRLNVSSAMLSVLLNINANTLHVF